jgi:demethylmenaquinone methyltransferase/2-methoxy-6-polyprenyl-1,4-benzoquinol methylase
MTSPLDKRPAAIQRMFTGIAARYDLLNRLISLGFDQSLRRQMIARLMERNPKKIADIGCGTGDVAILLAKAFPNSQIVACDMTLAMIQVGKQRTQHPAIQWVVCDSLYLPFENEKMDAIISAFLLRNVADLAAVLLEQARVTVLAGTFLTLETTPPPKTLLYPFIWLYYHTIIPLLGWLVAGNSAAYQYLPDSSLSFISAEQLSQAVADNGWQQARVDRRFLGVMAIHQAQKSPH